MNWEQKKVFDGDIIAEYYDFSDQKIRKGHETFRLRKVGEDTFLTFKRQVSKDFANIREEIEVKVGNFENMKQIIQMLGMEQYDKLLKHRKSYYLNDIHVDIDIIPGIPTFLEIEAPNTDILKEYIVKLGYTYSEIKTWGYNEVIDYYKNKS